MKALFDGRRSFANGVDAAEEAVSGIRAKILSGEVKPTAAELAAVSRAAPEERPALVAKLCKPKDEKRAGRKEKKAIVRAKAENSKPRLRSLASRQSFRPLLLLSWHRSQ